MNEDIYYNLICPYIHMKDRQICSRRDHRLLSLKNKKKVVMNAYAYIHQGSPCYKYCICRYFEPDDIVRIYHYHCSREST